LGGVPPSARSHPQPASGGLSSPEHRRTRSTGSIRFALAAPPRSGTDPHEETAMNTSRHFPFAPTRRSFVGLSAAAFATVALAACGSDSGEEVDVESQNVGAMDDSAADTQPKATEPIQVSMLWTDWPEVPVEDTWRLFDHIKELTNVEITLTHIPFSDATEKRSLLISAGDAPTLIPLVYTGEDAPFVSSGAVVPLSDYRSEERRVGKVWSA